MISVKAIQTSFTLRHGSFPEREMFRKKRVVLSFCKFNPPENSDQETPPEEDSRKKQELLAKIAMLQTQKVRLTHYLDERSAYLTEFAEEANAEIDQIGENALKELDEAGARIMENIESRMQAFEESMELNKLEIEENEKKVANFEGKVEKDMNEGMFFKNLTLTSLDKTKDSEEAEISREPTKKTTVSVIKRNICSALIVLVAYGIADALMSSSYNWGKVAILGFIMVGLLSLFIYEQRMLSEIDTIEQDNGKYK